ncbi:S-locus-specific glycoprotein S13 [Cardamine amara subsp. amara]|uniref:S-locus-specific glycoprotein S13 n=1 Tax=Cardamine amara subsp. amara TaxID=228776 RepID=A0ABD1AGB6_CARAN
MMTDRCYSFLVIFVIISATCSLADGTVLSSTVPFTLSRNKTIVSHGDVFELGLFKPDSSSRDGNRWYLGIWFKKIPTRTYVWVANRDKPLSIPVGTIRVLKSNLVLFDQSDTVVWSTNVTGEDGRSPLVAKLLDNGNFVLGYSNASEYLWQSFDFPTDTLIPGMKLGWERRTGRYSFLRSWKDITDPSTGDF